jgi:tripeptide aminopeptidase
MVPAVSREEPVINRERLVAGFLELVQISSPSRREGPVAKRLMPALAALGASIEVDDAGNKVGGDTGNVLARVATSVAACAPSTSGSTSRTSSPPPPCWSKRFG